MIQKKSKNFLFNECKEKSKNWRQHVLIKADRQFFGRMLILQEKRGMSQLFTLVLLQNDYIQVLVHIIPSNLLIDC